MLPDILHTSLMRRAIMTANLALDAADRHWIPVKRDWRLNERHYGALQGKNKKQTLEEFGEEQFMLWRRSLRHPAAADRARLRVLPGHRPALRGPRPGPAADRVPARRREARCIPYWESAIVPDLRTGKTVLVAAHGNSLRALVKHLDGISDEDIAGLNIPTGIPLRYDLDEDLQARSSRAASTSTRTPPRTPSRRSPTRAADPVSSEKHVRTWPANVLFARTTARHDWVNRV